MVTVGLTGSIGSGKSTVARLLADRGAVVVDADEVTRTMQRPGHAVFEATVRRFGAGIVTSDGQLDRRALASVVFSDANALADLEALTHPAVRQEMARRLEAVHPDVPVRVAVVPLLLESSHYDVAATIVVDCPERTVIARLALGRGMREEEVRSRLERQLSRPERLARADVVIDNSGPPDALAAQVDRAWAWVRTLDQTP